jgi:methylenetetrahydrofolate dehydrogenase (NADP+)/methenyltetrahydrofolate cyclohydrolase
VGGEPPGSIAVSIDRLGAPLRGRSPRPAELMDGAAVARRLLDETRERAAAVHDIRGRAPALATVLVGDDPASHTYVKMKVKRCRAVGIDSVRHDLLSSTSTVEAVELVQRLVADPMVAVILVQHPMPPHVDERAVFEAISLAKDVDGVTAGSFLSMANGGDVGFASCTPAGIIALLDAYQVQIAGQHAVVIGRSAILGKPAAMLLLGRDATVTICHSKTCDLPHLVAEAEHCCRGRGALAPGADPR